MSQLEQARRTVDVLRRDVADPGSGRFGKFGQGQLDAFARAVAGTLDESDIDVLRAVLIADPRCEVLFHDERDALHVLIRKREVAA